MNFLNLPNEIHNIISKYLSFNSLRYLKNFNQIYKLNYIERYNISKKIVRKYLRKWIYRWRFENTTFDMNTGKHIKLPNMTIRHLIIKNPDVNTVFNFDRNISSLEFSNIDILHGITIIYNKNIDKETKNKILITTTGNPNHRKCSCQ